MKAPLRYFTLPTLLMALNGPQPVHAAEPGNIIVPPVIESAGSTVAA